MELLVVVAIVGVLVALLMPAVQSMRQAARRSACASNMRQVGIGIIGYAESRRGNMPLSTHDLLPGQEHRAWIFTVAPFLEGVDEIRICPSDPNGPGRLAADLTSYILNSYVCIRGDVGAITNLSRMPARSKTFVAFETSDQVGTSHADHTHGVDWFKVPRSRPNYFVSTWSGIRAEIQTDRHIGGSHYLYADGHVEWLAESVISEWVLENFNFPRPPSL